MAKVDLSKFAVPEKNYLKPKKESGSKIKESVKTKKEVKAKETKKIGRPMISDEPLNIPVTVNFSSTEYDKIKESAGIAAVSAFIRESLKKSGII